MSYFETPRGNMSNEDVQHALHELDGMNTSNEDVQHALHELDGMGETVYNWDSVFFHATEHTEYFLEVDDCGEALVMMRNRASDEPGRHGCAIGDFFKKAGPEAASALSVEIGALMMRALADQRRIYNEL
jgi:hypothetical protein